MPRYLLLGAGFSRNWGGWVASEAFEYLLGAPEILADTQLRDLLWKHQLGGGFEDALAELQGGTSYARQPWTPEQLVKFQGAVGRMFDDMNRAFLSRKDLEFRRDLGTDRLVSKFLGRFDAIFTLNQDVLLEQFYVSDKLVQSTVGPYIPGMQRLQPSEPLYSDSFARADWHPRPESEFKLNPRGQPYMKLHGSANWFSSDGHRVLVIGGAKQQEIGRHPILKWYAREFARFIREPKARLMVIGYGFRDNHVNDAISEAVAGGLRMFVIDHPHGAELAIKMNETRQRASIAVATPLEIMLQQSLIGGSRRSLADIFGGDDAEFQKVMRFFDLK
jgi:SIR2-like protein